MTCEDLVQAGPLGYTNMSNLELPANSPSHLRRIRRFPKRDISSEDRDQRQTRRDRLQRRSHKSEHIATPNLLHEVHQGALAIVEKWNCPIHHSRHVGQQSEGDSLEEILKQAFG